MNERQERIERLAKRWLEAQTSQAEERELRELLRGGDLPESLRGWALLFDGFDALSAERLPETAAERLPETAARRESEGAVVPLERIRRRRAMIWSAVAAAVALGVLLGAELLRRPYCYIDGKPVYDREVALRTTAYFNAFAVLDAPGRMVDDLIENH